MKTLQTAAAVAVLCALVATATAQSSLTDKLSEEETFYQNYGKEAYSKLKIEKDVIGLYDYFGEHITDGTELFNMRNKTQVLDNENEGVTDSMLTSQSSEYQHKDFFEKFSNLVLTQDAIGGTKMSFLVGDQITTKLTPLTFNKTNYKGIRWDVWSTGLQFSLLLSRTRPGILSMKGISNTSLVEYPTTEASFPGNYYYNNFMGTGDYSAKSPYGDYDMLWAVHAQNNIANKVDVGLTYINHHVSDTKKGEKWLFGQMPNGWMPSEIHFEFSDLTPLTLDDAGVYVYDVKMKVNGSLVEARPAYRDVFRQVFVGSQDSVLRPRDLPIPQPQTGTYPIIVAFKTNPDYWFFKGTTRSLTSASQIKSISFEYQVAGNYLVFVSTSRQIPLNIDGEKNAQTGEVVYTNPEKQVSEIFEGTGQPLRIDATGAGNDPRGFSTTYYGEYVRKAPKHLTMNFTEFEKACLYLSSNLNRVKPITALETYNFGTYEYTYGLNLSSVTYGVDFRGELGGVKFSGEAALNQREDKLPGREGENFINNRLVGTLKAERPVGKNLGVSGDLHYIAPDWQTNLYSLQTSRYFKETYYKTSGSRLFNIPDYLVHPRPLSNDWSNIDDNDDNDAFVESDRRRYPSDLSNDAQGSFYQDGIMNYGSVQTGTAGATGVSLNGVKTIKFPTDMLVSYDDPDGVIASKDDRNRNGTSDYREDFLLFTSDPPVFELGIDLNNNGIPDYEDDDILPDYGYSVGYLITSDAIKTQGIRGVGLNVRWTPRDYFTIDVGGLFETILDYDLNGIDDLFEEGNTANRDFFEGKSLVGYSTQAIDILRRSQGIQLKLGNELRYIRDAIRNDVVTSTGVNSNGVYVVNYSFKIDPLNFRHAFVDNLIADIVYNNIRNFEYGFRAKLGVQQRLAIASDENDDQDSGALRLFYKEYSFYDPLKEETRFAGRLETFPSRTIGDVFLVNRVNYRFGFKNEFEDWRKFLNAFNRLEIIPQYKIGVAYSREIIGPTKSDPRDLEFNLRADLDRDGEIDTVEYNTTPGADLQAVNNKRIDANEYRDNNRFEILNVPILRVNYKIAENTQFQFGLQWKRLIDYVSPEQNALNTTVLGQIVSKANYKGYNVTFFLGARWQKYNMDVNAYDPVILTGNRYDRSNWEFFAQLFSGS